MRERNRFYLPEEVTAARVTWFLLGMGFGIFLGAVGVLTWAYMLF